MKQLTIFDLLERQKPTVFFNTINAKGKDLEKYREEAKTGEAIVMREFEKCNKMTSLECARRTGMNLNSCRRAITVLTKGENPKLEILEEKIVEEFGKPNHYYQNIISDSFY